MFTIVINVEGGNADLVEDLCQELERLLSNHQLDGEVEDFGIESSNDEE